jgi:hypothetical protein
MGYESWPVPTKARLAPAQDSWLTTHDFMLTNSNVTVP